MNMDGSAKENLTISEGVDWVYHSIDNKIYFVSDRDTTQGIYFLFEMDIESKKCRKMYTQPLFDSWLSTRNNGREFIVCTDKGGDKVFMLIDSVGNEIREVLRAQNYDIGDPCFSPDGKWIAFRSNKSGHDELWLIDERGLNEKQLTYYPLDNLLIADSLYHAGPPQWNPTSQLISFTSHQYGNYSIFTIDREGKNLMQITSDSLHQGWHSWSPDGQWITYSGAAFGAENYDIYLMRVDGSENHKLTDGPSDKQAPLFVQPCQDSE